MNKSKYVCGVILSQNAYSLLCEPLKPYLRTGPVGKYIYCKSAQQNGSFLDIKFSPEMHDGVEEMLISIPIGFVLFIASAAKSLPIGFIPDK